MLPCRFPGPFLLAIVLGTIACSRASAPRGTRAPASTGSDVEEDEGPSYTYVSTDANREAYEYREPVVEIDPFHEDVGAGHAVTSPETAKELAEAAVTPFLNPRQSWRTSPLLPAVWPTEDEYKLIMVLYYPMADHPHSMSHYQLFSAAYRVTVSLVDGTTEVQPLKARRLGTVKEKRASMLERSELEVAERSLVYMMLGGDPETGEDNFWGYLKYFHEHPKFARDIKRRAPKFVGWLHSRKRGRR
jgi:hypothetical protein